MSLSIDEVEFRIEEMAGICNPSQARKVAMKICEHVRALANHSVCDELMSVALKLVDDPDSCNVDELRTRSVSIYESMYDGESEPSAQALAFSAFGEIAFTVDSKVALVNVGNFVARAIASEVAEQVDSAQYDVAFTNEFLKEKSKQLDAFRAYLK